MLRDFYVDDTPASSDMNVWVPAAFAGFWFQREPVMDPWIACGDAWKQDVVIAPRVNVKWSPTSIWDARLNAGRGYRRVHLFTEEHAALDGSRQVLLSEGGLNPESSWNANFSFTRTLGNEHWTGSASIQAFSTLFTDRIYADYDTCRTPFCIAMWKGWGEPRGQWRPVVLRHRRLALLRRRHMAALGVVRVGNVVGCGRSRRICAQLDHQCDDGAHRENVGVERRCPNGGANGGALHDDLRAELSEPYSLIHTSVNRSFLTEKEGVTP